MIRKNEKPQGARFCVLRGGSYIVNARYVRSANRFNFRPVGRSYINGLRVVMEIRSLSSK